MPQIAIAKLRARIEYDQREGTFRWARTGPKQRKGDIAGGLHASGYWVIRIDGVLYYAHQLAWLLVTGEWPTHRLKHRNRVRQDNRFTNLRKIGRGNLRATLS